METEQKSLKSPKLQRKFPGRLVSHSRGLLEGKAIPWRSKTCRAPEVTRSEWRGSWGEQECHVEKLEIRVARSRKLTEIRGFF